MLLSRIPPGSLRRLVVPVVIVYALAWIPFLLVGDPSQMVALQSAGTSKAAQTVVRGWSQGEVVDFAYLLGVDHVHLVAYSILLAASGVWAGRQMRGAAARWAPVFAWIAIGAAMFDVVENIGLIVMIRGGVDGPAPAITRAASFGKYSLATAAAIYAVAGIVARLRDADETSPVQS